MKYNILALLALAFFTSGPAFCQEPSTDLPLFSGTQWSTNLGTEFPGAKGSYELGSKDGKPFGKLTYDFSDGGGYVAAYTTVNIPDDIKEIRFSVKGEATARVLVRLMDSTGQVHQYVLPYSDPGNLQTLKIDLAIKPPASFFGAKDHVIHFPVTQLWLGVNKDKTASVQTGNVEFSGLKVLK